MRRPLPEAVFALICRGPKGRMPASLSLGVTIMADTINVDVYYDFL